MMRRRYAFFKLGGDLTDDLCFSLVVVVTNEQQSGLVILLTEGDPSGPFHKLQ